MESAGTFEPLADQTYVLPTTYRRDGTGVGTPVHVTVDGDRTFVRTWDTAWTLRRIRNNPEVEIAPSTARGKPTGPAVRARVLEGAVSAYTGRLLARKHPILHGYLIPLLHRLRGNRTTYIELTPDGGQTSL
jgi:PPOX class probable F420-dependent enzyme